MNGNVRISWFGIALIIVGMALLLDRFDVIDIDFSTVFWPIVMIAGILLVGRGFSLNGRGKIFWGTVLFLSALFFFLRSSEYVEVYGHMFPPATLLIFGIAFLMLYLHNIRDWYLLIPAVALCGVGIVFILVEYGYLYRWEVWEAVRMYWPIVLILFGVAIMLRRGLIRQKDGRRLVNDP